MVMTVAREDRLPASGLYMGATEALPQTEGEVPAPGAAHSEAEEPPVEERVQVVDHSAEAGQVKEAAEEDVKERIDHIMKKVEEIFRENFNMLLEENNMSQSEFAEKTGVAFQTVNRWANGHVLPPMATLNKIAETFDITPADVLKENPEKSKQIGPAFVDITDNYKELYAHLFGRESKLPADIIQVFHIVATDVLTYTQWYVLVHRYNLDGYGYNTYRAMGEKMNVSGQRVQQICARAELKLKNSVSKFQRAEWKCREQNTGVVNLSEKSMKEIKDYIGELMIQMSFDKNRALKPGSETSKDVPTREIPELSTHTKNALMRNKLYTLNSILSVPENDLTLMTGIGRSSVMEIRALRKMYTDSTLIPPFEEDDGDTEVYDEA